MVRSVPYEIVRHLGEVELRRYDDLILATVFDMDEVDASKLLSGYVEGNNERDIEIPMTAPVVKRTERHGGHDRSMSFLLPSDMGLEGAPRPRDPRVILEKKRGGLFAAIRFRGSGEGVDMLSMTYDMAVELKEADYVLDGRPFLLYYNLSLTPGFTRRNEVAARVVPFSSVRT